MISITLTYFRENQLALGSRFGPPLSFIQVSSWSWIDYPGSGLLVVIIALLKLTFAIVLVGSLNQAIV